jgi:transposase
MARDGKMDVHLGVSRDGYAGRLEVFEGPSGRRRRSEDERARIAAESLMPGVPVADVARRHGVTRWQVDDWRKRLRDGRLALPEGVASTPAFAALVVEEPRQATSVENASIEIVLGEVVIRVGPDVEEAHLSRVIRAVRGAG